MFANLVTLKFVVSVFLQDISLFYQIFPDDVLGSGQFGTVYGGECSAEISICFVMRNFCGISIFVIMGLNGIILLLFFCSRNPMGSITKWENKAHENKARENYISSNE